MFITCTACQKKLKISDGLAGKKVRCPGCKGLVPVPHAEEDTIVESIDEANPAPRKKRAQPADDDTVVESYSGEKPGPRKPSPAPPENEDTLRCPRCEAAAVDELPPNLYSRRPGFVCRMCKARMRPPGTTGFYVFAIGLGGGIALLAIGMAGLLFANDLLRGPRIGGVGGLLAAGLLVAGWALNQVRLPIPLGAPTPPARLGLWIGLLVVMVVVVPLLAFCVIFGFMYYVQEMM